MKHRQKEMTDKPPMDGKNPGKVQSNNQTAGGETPAISARELDRPIDKAEEARGALADEQRMRPLWATFRNILLVVFVIFICAMLQMFMLWRVCNTGMKTAATQMTNATCSAWRVVRRRPLCLFGRAKVMFAASAPLGAANMRACDCGPSPVWVIYGVP